MQKTYTTEQAIELLKQGKKIKHQDWINEDFCQIDSSGKFIAQDGRIFLKSPERLNLYYAENELWVEVEDDIFHMDDLIFNDYGDDLIVNYDFFNDSLFGSECYIGDAIEKR
jgi:hypothetical protein